jgi:unsaturated rhamnogalacturonyl hydrolase
VAAGGGIAAAPGAAGSGGASELLVEIHNPIGEARASETVSLPLADLQRRAPGLEPKRTVVTDAVGIPVLSQWVDLDGDEKPDALVFQVSLGPSESQVLSVKPGARAAVDRGQYRVYGRFARERHDDFAWENDRIAHRMYGPDLERWKAEPLVSSGIDVWCKRVRHLVVNDWYLTDTYHEDTGEGGDFYSVGKARGCGGLGVWTAADRRLAVSRNFTSSRVLANGPVRLVFELAYAPWDIGGGRRISEVKRVTLDAGQNFDHFASTFHLEASPAAGPAAGANAGVGASSPAKPSAVPAPLQVAIGIARHDGGVFEVNAAAGWLRSWEPLKKAPSSPSLGCAVVVPAGTVIDAPETDSDRLLVVNARAGIPLEYDAGFGWQGNGDFADRAAWGAAVEALARRRAHPLEVRLSEPTVPRPEQAASRATGATGTPAAGHGVAVPPAGTVASGGAAVAGAASGWGRRACDSAMARAPVLTDKWNYEPGLLLEACLQVAAETREPKVLAYVRQSVDRVLDEDGNIHGGYRVEDYNLDQVNMGKVLFPLLAAARDAGDAHRAGRYEKALRTLRGQLRNQPRTADGGFWHKLVYPRQMWLDGVYMASPFLAEYARVFHEPAALADAVHQVELAERHLRDPGSGLLVHGWDESRTERWANPQSGLSPHAWARGMGWYAMAVVDVLSQIPPGEKTTAGDNAAARAALLGILRRLAAAVARVQDPATGVWWQVLDAPRAAPNYPEASASAMFVYALSKGVKNGWLARGTYGRVADAGWRGLVERFVTVDGAGLVDVRQICKVAGLGGKPYRDGSLAYYTSTEIATNDLKGVGPFILAAQIRQARE